MRKALLPMIASLALCGAATGALIATNARADQSGRKPMMIALTNQEPMPGPDAAAPPDIAGGPPPGMMHDMGAHRAQFCKDMYARKVGELAFLEAKLSLTGNQQPLFDQWKQTSLNVAKQHQDDCTSHERHKPGQHPSVVDRLDMEETMLKRRLANIDAERPSLTAFYDSLNPQQKQEFGRAAMRRMAERGMRMHMMMGMMGRPHPPGMGGHMGHGAGAMGPGPMEPGAMGDAPPPSPPPGQ